MATRKFSELLDRMTPDRRARVAARVRQESLATSSEGSTHANEPEARRPEPQKLGQKVEGSERDDDQ